MLRRSPLLFISIALVFIGIIEIYYRHHYPDLMILTDIIQTSDDPILGYELIPDSRATFEGITVKIRRSEIKISSQGLRDRYYNPKKLDDVRRVAFMGDSFVFGLGIDSSDAIPKQLEYLLNKHSSVKYEVMNCGVIGYNLTQEVRFLQQRILRFDPDIIIFLITGNDVGRKIKRPSNRFSNFIFRHSYLYQRAYLWLENHLKRNDLKPKSLKDLSSQAYADFKGMTRVLNSRQKVLVAVKNFSGWMKPILDICEKKGFYVLDFTPIFRCHNERILLSKYDQHFNSKGAQVVASEIYTFLQNKVLNDETGFSTEKPDGS